MQVLVGDTNAVYLSTGSVPVGNQAFQQYSYNFTTPDTLIGLPTIRIANASGSGDHTVDFTAIAISLLQTPPATNNFIVQVVNDNNPRLGSTQQFNVVISQPSYLVSDLARRSPLAPANSSFTLFQPNLANGAFTLEVRGNAGQNYVLEMATNLDSSVWVPLQTNLSSPSDFTFTDRGAANSPQRFYRIKIFQP
jgi:hypothetical protein